MTARIERVSTATLVWLFSAYAWAASTVCAAWFAYRFSLERGAALAPVLCLVWQGLVFGAWLPAGGLVWLLINRFGATGRGLAALTLAMLPVVLLEAVGGSALDILFAGGGDFAGLGGRAIAKAPVAILLWTALCAIGLAAAQRNRALDARRRADMLESALVHARQAVSAPRSERLLVTTGRRRASVMTHEVEWFASAGNYVVVHWQEREGLVRTPLKVIEATLDPAVFARTHRSTIVNLAYVADVQPLSDGSWRLTMASGGELVVSRAFRDEILARLGRPALRPSSNVS
ncbi:LytTr DNA-binding domain protein [compost metagenome]